MKMLDKYFPLYALTFLFALIITVLLERRLIPVLKEKAQQPIYEEGPKWHVKKSGTPTMGGLGFLAATVTVLSAASIIFAFLDSRTAISLILCLAYAVLNSLIGVIDDYKKLSRKENGGLTPREKLLLQAVAAASFIVARALILKDGTAISFSFGEVDLGLFYYPIALLVLLGIVNCANLTDGIDGLASSVAFSIGVSLFYISAALNEETALVSAAVIGSSVGFLFFNIHPAKIFMGDTGSLFFGALVVSCAFTLKNPILMLFICGVYVIEGISVVLQVTSYKLTRKRIFKMAPLHHHFEQCGWSENKICIAAILLTFVFSIPAYILYLP